MTRWSLLEQQPDGRYADTDDTVEADTWGVAVERLLAFELCRSALRGAKVWDALELDVKLGSQSPAFHEFTCSTGHYKVVPIASDDETHLQAITREVGQATARVLRKLIEGQA